MGSVGLKLIACCVSAAAWLLANVAHASPHHNQSAACVEAEDWDVESTEAWLHQAAKVLRRPWVYCSKVPEGWPCGGLLHSAARDVDELSALLKNHASLEDVDGKSHPAALELLARAPNVPRLVTVVAAKQISRCEFPATSVTASSVWPLRLFRTPYHVLVDVALVFAVRYPRVALRLLPFRIPWVQPVGAQLSDLLDIEYSVDLYLYALLLQPQLVVLLASEAPLLTAYLAFAGLKRHSVEVRMALSNSYLRKKALLRLLLQRCKRNVAATAATLALCALVTTNLPTIVVWAAARAVLPALIFFELAVSLLEPLLYVFGYFGVRPPGMSERAFAEFRWTRLPLRHQQDRDVLLALRTLAAYNATAVAYANPVAHRRELARERMLAA